jgi:hypothetical protein
MPPPRPAAGFRVENRWWRLPTLVRSLLAIELSVLLFPLLLGWALGDGYLWLVIVVAVAGVTLWWITEQRHRSIGP